jgi:hypothetical protein
MTRWIVALIAALWFLLGCGSSRQAGENADLQMWVGTWQGMALQENRSDPPRQWILVLSLDKNRLIGVMSDDRGEMRRKKVENLKVVDGELYFTVSYETSRGLQMDCRHRIRLQDDILLSHFDGREGGRALEGKWEARKNAGATEATQ